MPAVRKARLNFSISSDGDQSLIPEMRIVGSSCIARRPLWLSQPVQTSHGMPPECIVGPKTWVVGRRRLLPTITRPHSVRQKMSTGYPGLGIEDPRMISNSRAGVASVRPYIFYSNHVPSSAWRYLSYQPTRIASAIAYLRASRSMSRQDASACTRRWSVESARSRK
jgi:hypothetical protein